MKKLIVKSFCVIGLPMFLFLADAVAACSGQDLTRCLDSACVQNSGNNADRCRLCGTDLAANGYLDNNSVPKMKTLSLGTDSKNILSATELKSAPITAGARYVWATTECIKKIDGCTADHVTKTYDSLIEQSCKYVVSDNAYSKTLAAQKVTESQDSCNVDISSCLIADVRCGSNWVACEDTNVYAKFLSECIISSGCGNFTENSKLAADALRDRALNANSANIQNIIKKHSNARESKLKSASDACADNGNAGKKMCANSICKNMPNSCGDGFDSERVLAENICKYVNVACERLK